MIKKLLRARLYSTRLPLPPQEYVEMPGSYTVSTPSGPRSIGRRMPKTAAPVSPDAAARAAASATRRADAKKMMSERAEAKKVSDAAAAAKKAESNKAVMAAMEARRAKRTARPSAPVKAPATSPQNTGPENVGARPVPMARYKKGGSVSCKTY